MIEQIKEKSELVAYAKRTLELKKSGHEWTSRCPFHDENTPSFSIDEKKQLFYCFGCGAGGDIFEFVKLTHGMDFKQSMSHLAEIYGVSLEDRSNTLTPPVRNRGSRKLNISIAPKGTDSSIADKLASNLLRNLDNTKLTDHVKMRGWSIDFIKQSAEGKFLGLSGSGNLSYLYPHGIKVRNDWSSSRGDRWLSGAAKNNLWRFREEELVNEVLVFEGESDLIYYASHHPEGIDQLYVAIAGASNAKISCELAYELGSFRTIRMMFDNDEAGERATVVMGEILAGNTVGCTIEHFDWTKYSEVKDISEIKY